MGEGPFTIFAPTDQAFLDAGIDLSSVEKAELRDLLLYHVVSGEVASTDLSDCMTATAFNGQPLAFTVGDSVLVNDATVTSPDVATSNGIIHVMTLSCPRVMRRTMQLEQPFVRRTCSWSH